MNARHRHPRRARFHPFRIQAVILFGWFLGTTLRSLAVMLGVPAGWQWTASLLAVLVTLLVVYCASTWWLEYPPPDPIPEDSPRPGGS
jgi:hypothetical protein